MARPLALCPWAAVQGGLGEGRPAPGVRPQPHLQAAGCGELIPLGPIWYSSHEAHRPGTGVEVRVRAAGPAEGQAQGSQRPVSCQQQPSPQRRHRPHGLRSPEPKGEALWSSPRLSDPRSLPCLRQAHLGILRVETDRAGCRVGAQNCTASPLLAAEAGGQAVAGLGPRPTVQSCSAPPEAGAPTATPRALLQHSGCEMGTCSAHSRHSALSADGHTAQEPRWPSFRGGRLHLHCVQTVPLPHGLMCTYCARAPLTTEGQVQL